MEVRVSWLIDKYDGRAFTALSNLYDSVVNGVGGHGL